MADRRESVQSLERALDILEALAVGGELGVTELATRAKAVLTRGGLVEGGQHGVDQASLVLEVAARDQRADAMRLPFNPSIVIWVAVPSAPIVKSAGTQKDRMRKFVGLICTSG